ncbi:PTS sugar transporter subunit IIA [uncultured Lactobacillus sp.]|uniref:PTS sugar transporter subunit IIA n=1 Tax=uncultured Lactobacillus sp. TaxID=153152 RepID=UPI0026014ADF|nr:PTS sugar transporter subunit IIA [uncultured Lactobacillus sp.]
MTEILLKTCDRDLTNQRIAFQVIAGIVACKMNVRKETVLQSLSTREKIANTALVKGVAIPHIILDRNFSPWLLIFKSNTLISDWNCLDNSKVNKLICLIVPRVVKKSSSGFREIIAIMNKLADDTVITKINEAENAAEIAQILKR